MATSAPVAEWWIGEDAIRLSCVPRHVPVTAAGRPITRQSVYLWTTRGPLGVRLRRFRIGGQWFTTKQELARWQVALTAHR